MYQTRLRLDDATAKKLKEVAEKERRSINNMICYAIEQYTSKHTHEEESEKNGN